jgi:hypothetical protein
MGQLCGLDRFTQQDRVLIQSEFLRGRSGRSQPLRAAGAPASIVSRPRPLVLPIVPSIKNPCRTRTSEITKTKPSKCADRALRRKLEPPNQMSASAAGQNHRSWRMSRWSIRASSVATQVAAISSAIAARDANPSCRSSNSISASQQPQIKVTSELKIKSFPIAPPSRTLRRARLRHWRRYQKSARRRPERGSTDSAYSSRRSPTTVSWSRAASNRPRSISAHRDGPGWFMTSPPSVLSLLATSSPESFAHPQALDFPRPRPRNSVELVLRELRCLSPAGN